MKKPKISFDTARILGWLVHHGEKVIVAIFGLVACGLAFGGVASMRTMTPSDDKKPAKIIEEAEKTAKHIEAVTQVPENWLTKEQGLQAKVETWLAPTILPPPPHTDLNKPLFRELSKRGSPEILPVKDLHTVAGLAIVAVRSKTAADRVALDRPAAPEGNAAQRAGKPSRGGRSAPPQPPSDTLPPAPRPDAPQAQSKLMPYVIVTGLIPVARQREEFERRFKDASLRDPVADTPIWTGYQVEKMEVIPGVAEKWTPVDMKVVAKKYSSEWAGLQAEPLQPMVALSSDLDRRDPAASPIPFCSPLPQVVDKPWGLEAVHPWFVEYLQRHVGERRIAEENLRRESEESGTVFGGGNPAAGAAVAPGFMSGPGGPGMPAAAPADGNGTGPQDPEYRLFRFIDLAVEPGRAYRYRVKVSCWNPNYNVNSRHLADAALAKVATLASPPSDPTTAILVPDGIRMLAEPLSKEQVRKLKPGMVSVAILGPKPGGGALALRTLVSEVGGLANVDPQLNKKGDARSQGDAIVTDRVLLDVRGKLEDRAETRAGRVSPPSEPLEMIFLRPDGTFDATSAADSQADLTRYRSPEAGEAAPGGPEPPQRGDAAFGNPFAPK